MKERRSIQAFLATGEQTKPVLVVVEPPDHDLTFDQLCRWGHEECSDHWNGPCTQPEEKP